MEEKLAATTSSWCAFNGEVMIATMYNTRFFPSRLDSAELQSRVCPEYQIPNLIYTVSDVNAKPVNNTFLASHNQTHWLSKQLMMQTC
jgi:hypothetical protein